MPTPAKKKRNAPSAQANTLLNHFGKNGGSPAQPVRGVSVSPMAKGSDGVVTAGTSEDIPYVISDSEEDESEATVPKPMIPGKASARTLPLPRNRSRSNPPSRTTSVASMAPRPTDLQTLGESILSVQKEIETAAEDTPVKGVNPNNTDEPMDVDGWNNEAEEGMGMEDPDPDEDADLYVDLTGEPLQETESSDWETDNEALEYERPEKRKHQDDILDLRCDENGESEYAPSSRQRHRAQRPISSFCLSSPDPASGSSGKKSAKGDMGPPKPVSAATAKGPNAFAMLMSGPHKAEEADWKVAEIDLKRDGTRVSGRRKAPFYKVMTGMPIAVDAFRYSAIPGIKAYFLSHAHSDHYTNLSGSWKHGPVYCSVTTANLIQLMLGVDAKWVHGIPWDTPYEIPDTGGVMVTVLHANHCPGSALFLFEGRQTINAGDSAFKSTYIGGKRIWRYLHCGDFRACPAHLLHPAVQGKKIDTVYLDTTYLNPAYCFPPQPLVIKACAELAGRIILGRKESTPVKAEDDEDVKPYLTGQVGAETFEMEKGFMDGWLVKEEEGEKPDTKDVVPGKVRRTLVIIGTYSIGKERVVKGVAKMLESKIYCDARKREILKCEADSELHAMLTDDPAEAGIHLVPLQTIQLDRLQAYLHKMKDSFNRILAFRPTGWTYTPPAGTDTLPKIDMVIKRDQSRTFAANHLRPMRGSCWQIMMFGCPYSEHSSFFELSCFALSLSAAVKYIPTVNVNSEKSRAKMKKWFERWQQERVRREKAGLHGIVDYRDETFW